MNKANNQWWVRDVDEATKHRYKVYAVTHKMTIGQAVALASTLLDRLPAEAAAPTLRDPQKQRHEGEQSATK